jgi:transposase
MDAIVVGIDVSTDRLDVAVRPSGESFAVSRDASGLGALINRLQPLTPQVIALEATGGYETVVAAGLAAAALPVVIVTPAQIRAFALALGQRAKTDPLDAGVIAHFIEATKPAVRPLRDADTQRLADLLARRGQIIDLIVAECQRQKRLTGKSLQKSMTRLLAALQTELSALETDIDDAVRAPRPGATKRTCWPPSRASARLWHARSWPNCQTSARSTAGRSVRSPASRPGPGSPASGKAGVSSAAAGPGCARPCSWPPWSAHATPPC